MRRRDAALIIFSLPIVSIVVYNNGLRPKAEDVWGEKPSGGEKPGGETSARETSENIPASPSHFQSDYLPPTVGLMAAFYREALDNATLGMMLPPSRYVAQRCAWVEERAEAEYAAAVARVDFSEGPKFKMPWYYHDPNPLCGRYLLRHWEGPRASPVVLRPPPSAEVGAEGQLPRWVVADGDGVVAEIDACGQSLKERDVLLHIRAVGERAVAACRVVPVEASRGEVRCRLPFPGRYVVEAKLVHVNGSAANPFLPKSLGVIGIRASDKGRKSFKYNLGCDMQRHLYGSPAIIHVVDIGSGGRSIGGPTLCAHANHTVGAWVRIDDPHSCGGHSTWCYGNPSWLDDACGFNEKLVWVPEGCKVKYYTPPIGPTRPCLRSGRTGFFLLTGDSVIREYAKSCADFNLRGAKLACLFNNIALEGQHYSPSYARATIDAMLRGVVDNDAAVFATNLGIHHLIGPCTTQQWTEYVDTFVDMWIARNLSFASHRKLEVGVWISPPTIHYARKGMGYQRAVAWDDIAWRKLRPLGFERLDALAPTLARTEATWDGLHYAAARGKVQSPWRIRRVAVRPWNGGVAHALFTLLLNIVCHRPGL